MNRWEYETKAITDMYNKGGLVNEEQLAKQEAIEKEKQLFAGRVQEITNEISDMLIRKNESYGNSALNPVRVFSQSDSVEQIKVRIDDKLSRIARADANAFGEDTVKDLIGYLILLLMKQAEENA